MLSIKAAQKFADAAETLNAAATQQKDYLYNSSRELNKTLADAHDLIIHTDLSLNGSAGKPGVLPAVSGLIDEQRSDLDVTDAKIDRALNDLDAAEKGAQRVLAQIDDAAAGAARATNAVAIEASGPNITDAIERLDESTREADATLGNLQQISASGNRDAAMIEKRLREALKPASLVKRALLGALGIAAPATQLVMSLR